MVLGQRITSLTPRTDGVSEELRIFLEDAKLPQLVSVLTKLGFSDVEDFARWDAAEFSRLRSTLESEMVQDGHINMLERRIREAEFYATVRQMRPLNQAKAHEHAHEI